MRKDEFGRRARWQALGGSEGEKAMVKCIL